MNRESQPLVSIVTPVYNEAEYLAECIESVLAQRYENWEYTIVDNCSKDGSAEIARHYAGKDRRIRLVQNQVFLKAIPNHNVALRQISTGSKYCKMVLGDDWIFPECLDRMVACAEEHPSIGIVGAYGLQGDEVICGGLPYSTEPYGGIEVCRKHFLEKVYVFGSATSVLYRSDLIRRHHPLYNETNIHADTEACFKLLRESDFGFVHQVLTFTRVRPKSLTALSTDLQTHMAGTLQLLMGHGPAFLTREELESCLHRHISAYYNFLGKNWLRRRGEPEFWNYHKQALENSGVGFSNRRLALAVLAGIVSASLNPQFTVRKVMSRRLQSEHPESNEESEIAHPLHPWEIR